MVFDIGSDYSFPVAMPIRISPSRGRRHLQRWASLLRTSRFPNWSASPQVPAISAPSGCIS